MHQIGLSTAVAYLPQWLAVKSFVVIVGFAHGPYSVRLELIGLLSRLKVSSGLTNRLKCREKTYRRILCCVSTILRFADQVELSILHNKGYSYSIFFVISSSVSIL